MALSNEIFYVYRKDGSKIRVGGTTANPEYLCVRELQLEDNFLGQKQVTVTINSPVPIAFNGLEYITVDGENYTLKYTPSTKKQARKREYGEAFVYDNVIFQSLTDETTRVEFRDFVLEDNLVHYSSMNTVYFFGTVKDLAMRIQANLDRVYTGDSKWTIVLGDDLPTTEKQKTYDKVMVWEAITDIWEEFKTLFYIKGRTLYIGCGSTTVPHDFMYGIGKGLKTLERKTDENNPIITRLHAYGSTMNLPYRYYNTLDQMCKANLEVGLVFVYMHANFDNEKNLDIGDFYFYVRDCPTSAFKATGNKFSLTGTIDNWGNLGNETSTKTFELEATTDLAPSGAYDPYLKEDASGKLCLHVHWEKEFSNDIDWLYKFTDYTDPSVTEFVKTATFLSYTNVNINYVPTSWIDDEASLISSSMYLPNLMLPLLRVKGNAVKYYDANFAETTGESAAVYKMVKTGSGGKDLDVYLESIKGVEQFGVLEATVIFDNDDDTGFVGLVDDENGIYPNLGTAEDGSNEVVSATQLTDAGVFDKDHKVTPTTFEVVVKPGFNPADCLISGETAQISFKSGALIGRSFDFTCTDNGDGTYTLLCNRENDDSIGLAFPNSSYNIKAGDKFVFLNIELPDIYIQKAEIRVLNAGLAYLANYDHSKYLYTPELDNIFLARTENREKRDALCAGANFWFTDEDINGTSDGEAVTIKLPISKLTMKIGNSMIREYEITLADTPDIDSDIVSRTVKAVTNAYASGSAGSSSADEGTIKIVGDKRYLSKLTKDTAQGLITFLAGLNVGAGTYGIDKNGIATLAQVLATSGTIEALTANSITADTLTAATAKLGATTVTNLISLLTDGGSTGDFGSGIAMFLTGLGAGRIECDELLVRNKAIFHELEIRKLSYSGGNIVLSPAGSVIERVTYIDKDDNEYSANEDGLYRDADGNEVTPKTYRCYYKADDGTTATTNTWKVNDQARCQTFNRATSLTDRGTTENRFYWRRVTAVSDDGYVDLSVTDCADNSDAPKAGDSIVQMGNRTNTDRQGFIYLQSEGEGSPSIEEYVGVWSYTLTDCLRTRISPTQGNLFTGTFQVMSGGKIIKQPVYRGDYDSTAKYSYYDQVTYNGDLWLCIVASGNATEAPSDSSQQWKRQTNKDQDKEWYIDADLNGSEYVAENETRQLDASLFYGTDNMDEQVEAWRIERASTDTAADTAWNNATDSAGNYTHKNLDKGAALDYAFTQADLTDSEGNVLDSCKFTVYCDAEQVPTSTTVLVSADGEYYTDENDIPYTL